MAQRFSTLTCPNCNCCESSFFVHNEAEKSFLCNLCGALNFLEEPEDENVATYAACYQSGMDNLRALRFSAAMEDFRDAYELIPSRPDALWGMICAEYGIVQVRGYFEKEYKAIYCRFAYHDAVPFGQNEYVAELKRLLRNETRLAAVYNKRLADAEMQIRNIRESTPKTDAWKWDVFIACKISKATEKFPEAQGRTPEHDEALKLYNDLTARGLRVFYSEKYFAANMGKPENDWQIMAALLNSRQMLLVCGGPNNREKLSTPWVRSEWERWRCMQEHKLKTDDSLLVYNIGDRYPSFPDGLKVTGNVIQASARNDLLTQLQRNCFTEDNYRREMSEGSNLMLQGKFNRAVKVFAKLSLFCPERAEPEVQLFLCECQTAMLSELELSRIQGDPYDNDHFRQAQERSYRKTSRAFVDLDNRIRSLREHEKDRELELMRSELAKLKKQVESEKPVIQPVGAPIMTATTTRTPNKPTSQSVTGPVSAITSASEKNKAVTELVRLLRNIAEFKSSTMQSKPENLSTDVHVSSSASKPTTKVPETKFERLLREAKGGDKVSQYHVAYCYYNGKDVEKNLEEAFRWFKMSAEKGYATAQCFLGYCYSQGCGTDVNKSEAFKWYKSAAELGDRTASYNLGLCYEYGTGTTKNLAKAKEWYQKAADKGHAKAEEQLKKLVKNATTDNRPVSAPILTTTATPAQSKAETRFDRLLRSAKGGDEVAQFELANCYYAGTGVEKNLKEAFRWYKMSAEKGYAPAQCDLGFCYSQGYGTEVNKAEAFKWYSFAAEYGDRSAQYNLGLCYEYGIGTTKNLSKAKLYYLKAANKNHKDAKERLKKL